MKYSDIIILLLVTKTLMCQSFPNCGFEDWHISNGVLSPVFWETANEKDYILVERTIGFHDGFAAQLNVIWDEVIKSYSPATITYSSNYEDGLIQLVSGYYKGSTSGNDSLMILIKQFEDDHVVQMGKKTLENTYNEWRRFAIEMRKVRVLIPNKLKIEISVVAEGQHQGITNFTIDELNLIK